MPAPDAAKVVDEIIELIAGEAEALLMGGDDEQLANINIRLALMHWDVLEDSDDCARHLELAEQHPLAPTLLLALAVSEHNRELLETAANAIAEASADAFPGEGGPAGAMRDVAEAWLYRFGDAGRAASVARAGLAKRARPKQGKSGGKADRLADELRHILWVALAASGEWGELASSVAETVGDPSRTKKKGKSAKKGASTGDDVDLLAVGEAVHLYDDRIDDRAAATELLSRFAGEDGPPAVRAFLAERALEIVARAGNAGVAELDARALLDLKRQLLDGVGESALEAAATKFLLSAELTRVGDHAAATALLTELTAPAVASGESAGWGPRLAAISRYRLAAATGDWVEAGAALRELGERGGAGELSAAWLRRAAEVFDARVGDTTRAHELWSQRLAADAGDGQAARFLERSHLEGEPAELVAFFESLAVEDGVEFAKRRAAAVAESRMKDVDRAMTLRREAVRGEGDVSGIADIARLQRRQRARELLARTYLDLAGKLKIARSIAALECSAGALHLSLNAREDAENAFVAAARHGPKDLTARAALASLYRRDGRYKDLVKVLGELAPLAANETTRLAALRELGSVTANQLEDPKGAIVHFEAALAIDGDDAKTLHALALLYDKARNWDKAVQLRQRAADAFAEPKRRIEILMEIGEIEQRQRRDDDAALRAYDAALEIDEKNLETLHAVAQVHRRRRRPTDLMEVLRRELELVDDVGQRLALTLEIAKTGESVEHDNPIEGYIAALEIDASNAEALAGVERIAKAESQWDTLASAFRQAPKNAANLAVLALALENAQDYAALASVRAEQIEFADKDADRAALALQAAKLYETHLSDTDEAAEGAIAMYQRCLGYDPGVRDAQVAVAKLLEAASRWPDLVAALERELTTVSATDTERQVALLERLGTLRRDKLQNYGDAALAYESLLQVEPGQKTTLAALEALQELYEKLDRQKDLLRVLERRAAAVEDAETKVALWTRIAEVKDERDDADGAVNAYRDAFAADPGSRTTFTAMEKLCYKHQRWNEAMALYDQAIELVEGGESRAYRLGDLYLRRGQVQLQYLGQPGEAAASYLRVVELDPDNDTAIKFLESIFSQEGDWAGLINAYETRAQLARDDEKRLETLRRAARVAGAKLKDPAEAARIYEGILAIDSSDKESLDALERFHERAQDWDKLVEVLNIRLESAPAGDTATALLRRIAQIGEEGMRDESRAIENYLRILEIAPGNKDALEALGRIYESTEQWSEFVDVTRRQIRVTTDRNLKALLYFKCGSVMEAKFGKEEDAIRYYDAAIKTSPSCLPAVHGLRDLYRRRKDWPRVIQTLELEVKLWQDDKERAGVFAQIGQIYAQRLGQPERALHYFESALAVDPECLPANKALFDQYYAAGDWSRAQPLAQALAQKAMREGDPTQRSDFYLKRGIVSRRTGDMRAAAESIIIALEIKPANLDALDALGDLAKAEPEAYDFPATYRELEKIYRKRDDSDPHQARVLVARAVMAERSGDLDQAEKLYAEALEKAPEDFTILLALVDLHANMRRWTHACDAIVRFLDGEPTPADDVRIRALMRLAQIHDEGEMDAHKASSVLREVIRVDATNQEAHYQLAQQMYLLGRFGEARQAIERVIELAAAPGADLKPESLARYYYYLGRIIEQGGDNRSAASRYRRAAEYDPGYAPPALALAKRAVDANDQRGAETLLINAAHVAMEQGGAEAAVPLQRGLARILLASGERSAAIEAYRGILAVEPDAAADRVALAEIYAMEDLPKAVQEVSRVLERDLRHAPAYRLLSTYCTRLGEQPRGVRVLSVMDLLGYAEDTDLNTLQQARSALVHSPLRGHISDELRQKFLVSDIADEPLAQVYEAVAAAVTGVFSQPPMGENLISIKTIDDPALKVAISDVGRLFGLEPEIYVGENVPGAVVAVAHPRQFVVLDRDLLTEPDAARRFVLGRAFEAIRGGYAMLLRFTDRERRELVALLKSFVLSPKDQASATREFVKNLPRRAIRVIERYQGQNIDDSDAWIDGLVAAANRAGLFACDDFSAAARMLFRLAGESMAVTQDGALALGAIPGGSELVRFYLAEDFHQTRDALANSAQSAPNA